MYLTEAVDELENSKLNKLELETALNVIKNYNYTFEKIIRTAKNAIKRFNYILARTYDKAERDWKKEHMISEFYNFKQNNTVENNRLSILDEIIN
jgi:hypothetical protein